MESILALNPNPCGSFLSCSFQVRIDDCMRQMASLLYQIKGPVNANSRNMVEADSDNMLRPLMDFLDSKWVDPSCFSIGCWFGGVHFGAFPLKSVVFVSMLCHVAWLCICWFAVCVVSLNVCVSMQVNAVCHSVWEDCSKAGSERAVEDCDEQPGEDHRPAPRKRHLRKA